MTNLTEVRKSDSMRILMDEKLKFWLEKGGERTGYEQFKELGEYWLLSCGEKMDVYDPIGKSEKCRTGIVERDEKDFVILRSEDGQKHLVMKNIMYSCKDIKAIEDKKKVIACPKLDFPEREVIGFLLLEAEKMFLVNMEGKLNKYRFPVPFKKIVFTQLETKLLLESENNTFVFMLENKVGQKCDFAEVKIGQIDVKRKAITDCPNLPYVVIEKKKLKAIYGIEERKMVQNFVNFEPKIEETQTEYRVYQELDDGLRLYEKIYDKSWTCKVIARLCNIETISDDMWIGRDVFFKAPILISNYYHGIRLQKGREKFSFWKEGRYILDTEEWFLYYAENGQTVTFPLPKGHWQLKGEEAIAIVYNKKRFSLYYRGECLLKNKRHFGDVPETDIKEIAEKYVIFSDGKKYRRKRFF